MAHFLKQQLLLGVLILGLVARGQNAPLAYDFTTLAGRTLPSAGSVDASSNHARFNNPNGITLDAAGNLYVADSNNHTIRKVTTNGTVTTFAGTAGVKGFADALGSTARFNFPSDIFTDTNGVMWIADSGNNCIRKLTLDGQVTNWAGQPGVAGSRDGNLANAQFFGPRGIAFDGRGNAYVADSGNYTIRKINPDGIVSTIAGKAGVSGFDDSSGPGARFSNLQGIRVSKTGLIFVADRVLRRISPNGGVKTLADPGSSHNYPAYGIVLDDRDYAYITDFYGSVSLVTPDERLVTIAGRPGSSLGSADGVGTEASFFKPAGICLDLQAGYLYVTESSNNTIRKVSVEGAATTLAGSPLNGFLDGVGDQALFNAPDTIISDRAGGYIVSDSRNGRLRTVSADGAVNTPETYVQYDRGGTFYKINQLSGGMAMDSSGTIYSLYTAFSIVQRITSDFRASTVAGQPYQAGNVDGGIDVAKFNHPQGIAIDLDNVIYVADTGNHSIRKVTPDGMTTTLAGRAGGGVSGYQDGTGDAALFRFPIGICVDTNRNIYVADSGNSVIRKITPEGMVSTFAGLGQNRGDADGTGTNARFSQPTGLAIDSFGNLYVADPGNHLVRRVAPDAVVTTLGGLGGSRGLADGVGTIARFNAPLGICVDDVGRVAVADTGNSAIRVGIDASITVPLIQSQPKTLSIYPGRSARFDVSALSRTPISYQWLFEGGYIPGATASQLVITNATAEQLGHYSVLLSNNQGTTDSEQALLRFADLPQLTIPVTKGTLQFKAPAYFGTNGIIQGSSDLIHWTNAGTLSIKSNTLWNIKPNSNYKAQFFRLKITP